MAARFGGRTTSSASSSPKKFHLGTLRGIQPKGKDAWLPGLEDKQQALPVQVRHLETTPRSWECLGHECQVLSSGSSDCLYQGGDQDLRRGLHRLTCKILDTPLNSYFK